MKEELTAAKPVDNSNYPSRGLEAMLTTASIAHTHLIQRPLRRMDAELPLPSSIEQFYYQNCGDFMEGCYISCITNITLTYAAKAASSILNRKNLTQDICDQLNTKLHTTINLISGAVAMGAVFAEEIYGIFSTPDLRDIPAGIAGALTYMACRQYSINNSKNKAYSCSEQPTCATPSF